MTVTLTDVRDIETALNLVHRRAVERLQPATLNILRRPAGIGRADCQLHIDGGSDESLHSRSDVARVTNLTRMQWEAFKDTSGDIGVRAVSESVWDVPVGGHLVRVLVTLTTEAPYDDDAHGELDNSGLIRGMDDVWPTVSDEPREEDL